MGSDRWKIPSRYAAPSARAAFATGRGGFKAAIRGNARIAKSSSFSKKARSIATSSSRFGTRSGCAARCARRKKSDPRRRGGNTSIGGRVEAVFLISGFFRVHEAGSGTFASLNRSCPKAGRISWIFRAARSAESCSCRFCRRMDGPSCCASNAMKSIPSGPMLRNGPGVLWRMTGVLWRMIRLPEAASIGPVEQLRHEDQINRGRSYDFERSWCGSSFSFASSLGTILAALPD
jgi:hypothetical protein